MLRESTVTIGTRLALFVTSAATALLTARLLGAEGRGLYSLLTQLVLLLSLAFGLGLGIANVYFASRRTYGSDVLAGNSLAATALLGLVAVATGGLAYVGLPRVFQGVTAGQLALALVAVPAVLGSQFLSDLVRGHQRLIAYNAINGLSGLFGAILLVVALLADPTVESVLLAYVLSVVVAGIAAYGYLAWAEARVRRPRVDWGAFRAALTFGAKGQAGNVVQYLNYRLGFFLVNYFLSPAAVGVFSIAVVLAESLWYVTNSVATVLFPRVSAADDPESARRLTAKASRLGLLVTLPLALGVAMTAPLLMQLFGREFAGGWPALWLLLPGTVAFGATNVLASYLAGLGHPQLNALVSAICFAVAVAASLVLIPLWGLNGAALANSLSYLAATVLTLYYAKRVGGIGPRDALWPAPDDWTDLSGGLQRISHRLLRR
ncbi:MAG: flippase [Chloroflexi bacterium]|nr:flippase [Chloroflexota bacterium]